MTDKAKLLELADLLNRAQRTFILRMEPHAEDQVITNHEFAAIDPCVDLFEGWPATVWWGGMRRNFGPGEDGIARFRFNDIGLELRALLSEASHAEG